MIDWRFGPKHTAYMRRSADCFMNVAEGAVRAGKTVDNVFAFAAMLESSPDRLHLASGSTIGNAKLNLGDGNGYGLEAIFRGRCRWGRHRDNECLFVDTAAGRRIVLFAGGGKSDSYRKIRGNSYGMWIATEINLHSDSFIREAFNRQLAAGRRRVFWDLNPCDPQDAIYRNYIDRWREQAEAGMYPAGFNYERFTIRDNPVMTPRRLAEIESQYEPGSVWYRRDILGERCAAEGLIYRQFADNAAAFTVERPDDVVLACIGVDFGGNGSAHAFCCVGFSAGLGSATVLREYYRREIISPVELERDFVAFAAECKSRWPVAEARCDSAEQTLIQGLRRAGSGVRVMNARKGEISERIRFVSRLMAQGRFFVSKSCPVTAAALAGAVFEEGSSRRRDDGSRNIDSLDAMEYALEPVMREMV